MTNDRHLLIKRLREFARGWFFRKSDAHSLALEAADALAKVHHDDRALLAQMATQLHASGKCVYVPLAVITARKILAEVDKQQTWASPARTSPSSRALTVWRMPES
jgi:hypothetical protein